MTVVRSQGPSREVLTSKTNNKVPDRKAHNNRTHNSKAPTSKAPTSKIRNNGGSQWRLSRKETKPAPLPERSGLPHREHAHRARAAGPQKPGEAWDTPNAEQRGREDGVKDAYREECGSGEQSQARDAKPVVRLWNAYRRLWSCGESRGRMLEQMLWMEEIMEAMGVGNGLCG
jgi:hypothetical protein